MGDALISVLFSTGLTIAGAVISTTIVGAVILTTIVGAIMATIWNTNTYGMLNYNRCVGHNFNKNRLISGMIIWDQL